MAPFNSDFAGVKNVNEMKLRKLKRFKKCTKFKTQEKKPGLANPVSINFQNGVVNEKYISNFNVTLTPKPNGVTDIAVGTAYGHTYKNSDINLSPKHKQVIVVRNKVTHEIKLVEVDTATLINNVMLDTGSRTITETDYSRDIKKLHKTFGGKRIATQIEQRERINVNPDLIAHEVSEAIASVKIESQEDGNNQETESISNLLPPCQRNASVVSEVYKLNEILQTEELEALKAEIVQKEDFKPLEYSKFFINCVEEVKKLGNDDDKLAGILFAEVLIKFLKIPSKKISTKSAVFCSFSNVIHMKLRNEFCVKTESSVTRPMTMRDKCLFYIIAVSLICCNYRINLNLLATAVSINVARLSRLARTVGATPVSKDDHVYVLKVPLPALPKVSKMKSKGKK